MTARVLLVSPRAVPGGAQRMLGSLVPRLIERGWDTHLLAGEEGELVGWARSAGAAATVAPGGPDGALDASVLAAVGPPDVVLSVGAAGHAWAGPLAGRLGVPACWWLDLTLTGRPVEARAARVPAAAVAVPTATAVAPARALPWAGTVPEVVVVPPGVDPGPVARHAAEARRIRARLGVPEAHGGPGPALLVLVARIDRVKGHATAIDAAALLVAAGTDVRLAVVGGAIVGHEGDLVAALRERVERSGLGGRVIFVGHVEDPGPWHAAADVALAPSAEEAFGLSVVESLAHGTPVVGSTAQGPSSILADGRFGLNVPAGDPEALAGAVGAVLADGALRERLSRAGPGRAATFSPAVAAGAWDAVLRRHGRAGCGRDG